MPGSPTTPGRPSTRHSALDRIAFGTAERPQHPRRPTFAAQWLAYVIPYRRIALSLAARNARLGSDVIRYIFIVVDLHHLLLADLPALLCFRPGADLV